MISRFSFWRLVIGLTALLAISAVHIARAQIVFSATPPSNLKPLDAAIVSGAIHVRLQQTTGGPWQFTLDGVNRGAPEKVSPFVLTNETGAIPGDSALWNTASIPNGMHVIKAIGTTTLTATFAVQNGAGTTVPKAPLVVGQDLFLTLTAPLQNVDGSQLTNLTGYRVYHGSRSREYGESTDIGVVTRYTLPELTVGTHYYAASAMAGEAEGEKSNEVVITVASTTVCQFNESRTQACTPPLVGNFTQTRAFGPPPACAPGEWLPAQPPAGVCAEPSTQLTTASTSAYQFKSATLPMGLVGVVAQGIPCGPETKLVNGVKYCKLTKAQVDLVVWPSDLTLLEYWAKASP